MYLIEELLRNVQPGPFFEDGKETFDLSHIPVRLIAYYLPQFHAIPENDEWWGKGFTEWTNVSKSFPQFRGHYQPHLPGELGFYDLRLPEVLYQQARLARRYGIYGFCLHHYWFAGKSLLSEPLKLLLANRDIDINFCLNWANENWTRRWNGSDKDILLGQNYSPEDDLALARSLEPALSDPRYIRIDGRPLFMVYRPALLPDIKATADRWREHFEKQGYGNPFLVMPQAFDATRPEQFGMDAAAGFPPHNCGFGTPRIRRWTKLINRGFNSNILSYDEMARRSMENRPSDFALFPGVCPSWDNHARHRRGTIFYGATPAKYGAWLRSACEYAIQQNVESQRLVFINAWNEWAEGAHLEPDRHNGYAYLGTTARVVTALSQNEA